MRVVVVVMVMVDFLVPVESSSSVHENFLENTFVRVLEQIAAQRWILASLVSIKEPERLHRKIIQHHELQSHEFNNSTATTMTRHRLSITLPLDGHAMSSEGLKSLSSSLNPCATSSSSSSLAGLWSLASPTTWSSILLGSGGDAPFSTGSESGTTTSHSRRGFWIDLRRSRKDNASNG